MRLLYGLRKASWSFVLRIKAGYPSYGVCKILVLVKTADRLFLVKSSLKSWVPHWQRDALKLISYFIFCFLGMPLNCRLQLTVLMTMFLFSYQLQLIEAENGRHFEDIFKSIYLNGICIFWFEFHRFFTRTQSKIPSLVQIMAMRPAGFTPLSELSTIGSNVLRHICIARLWWMNRTIR